MRAGEKKPPPPQARHTKRVDLALALRETASFIDVWLASRAHDAPAYTGGVWDSWPARETEALRICALEESAALALVQYEQTVER